MQPLNPVLAERMKKLAQAAKERSTGGLFTKSHSLTGKNAIVQPGGEATVRLAPRWDYQQSVIQSQGKFVPNPSYDRGQPAFVVAWEHWWEGDAGKWSHEWCPRTFDEQAQCAVCLASVALMASAAKEDREYGKKLQAKEVYIFNAVVGDPRLIAQDGLADIRILSLNGVQFAQVSDIMQGGENVKAAYGDITDPREGYDLIFKRPLKGGGDRWAVRPLPQASPFYAPAQASAFKGWATRLIDLEKMLSDETKDVLGIFRAFYGRDPNPDELDTGEPQSGRGTAAPAPPQAPGQEADPMMGVGGQADEQTTESASEPESPDDAFMPPPPPGQRAQRSPATPPGPAARTAPRPRTPRR